MVRGRLVFSLVTLTGLLAAACTQDAPETDTVPVAFGLARDEPGLDSAVTAISDPESDQYRQFLTVEEVQQQFGASAAVQDGALATLAEAGIDAQIDPTGGLAIADMTVADAEKVFDTKFILHDTTDGLKKVQPENPDVGQFTDTDEIASVVGLTASDDTTGTDDTASGGSTSSVDPDCNVGTDEVETAYTSRYGLAEPPAATDWSGVSVGFLSLDGLTQQSIDTWATCRGVSAPTINSHVVNGPSERPVTSESVLDATALALTAPGLSEIEMYQYDEESSLVFALAAVFDQGPSGSDSQVDLLSTSIVYCRADLTDEEIELTEWLLASMAATGTTVVAAAGDHGSGCEEGSDQPTVTYPAASPYVTAVGGTQFDGPSGSDDLGNEVVWNKTYGDSQAAGGGGAGTGFDTPAFQQDSGLDQPGRHVPDVAFVADPDAFGQISICDSDGNCEWHRVGGTSASAPNLAGALATLIVTSGVEGDHRIGHVAPLIYHLAAAPAGSDVFNDITDGDNDLNSLGCCSAASGADLATGWGSVNFGELAPLLYPS